MDNSMIVPATALLQIITSEQAWHYSIIPRKVNENSIEFYCNEKINILSAREELEILFGKKVLLTPINNHEILKQLSTNYIRGNGRSSMSKNSVSSENFLENIISEANGIQSSDIHIEPSEKAGRIRLRVDGKLIEKYIILKEDYPALINKIKILANLDIAEKRLPQDGRMTFNSGGQEHDIRVSVVPSIFGEKAVLRLLRKSASDIDLFKIGLNESQLSFYLDGVRKSHGIVLISGPTGSGKTTTLYATLNLLNKSDVNILTIEDPVEYTIEGINQVHLREDIGLSFSRALRTFLRQDPDIIMLGEIRDSETAQMAIRAALTGHLVLSTIHTNSAWGIITRLIDMGIPPFLVSSTLNLAVAQRLVRKLCNNCKQQVESDNIKIPQLSDSFIFPEKFYEPVGCDNCHHSGYSGRQAVFEVIEIDSRLREEIKLLKTDIKQYIEELKIKRLSQSAFDLLKTGVTSLDEIYPILISDT
jgi:general secretion pathway protein E/type IV pilus assembly protein PilB